MQKQSKLQTSRSVHVTLVCTYTTETCDGEEECLTQWDECHGRVEKTCRVEQEAQSGVRDAEEQMGRFGSEYVAAFGTCTKVTQGDEWTV